MKALILVLFYACAISWFLKAYFHFQLFKKKNNSDITVFDLWFNPFSYLYAKVFIFFPFYLVKAREENDEFNKLRRLIISFSWIGFVLFVVFGILAIYLEKQNT